MTVEGPRGAGPEFVDDDDAARHVARAATQRRLISSLVLVAIGTILVSSVTVAGQHGLTGADTAWVRTPANQRRVDSFDQPVPSTGEAPDGIPGATTRGDPDEPQPTTGTVGPTTGTVGPTIATSTTLPTPTAPAIVARPVPEATPAEPPPGGPPPAWADDTTRTDAGYLATKVGCAGGTSAPALDAFFRERLGPVIGHDYQHVYPLGGDRFLWIFQDTFIDHTGRAVRLDQASFAHNTAMLQDGDCFTLLHRGSAEAPQSFEAGTGEQRLRTWFWPMGGEVSGGRVQVFWAQMAKRPDPGPSDGLGWDPVRTWVATYDTDTLARTDFAPAPNAGVTPIYGYAVSSDDSHSYLFANTFDQRLSDQGGFLGGPHSARWMYLARVPKGRLQSAPEYWDGGGWSRSASRAAPLAIGDPDGIVAAFHVENPMQPRYLDGQWVAVSKVDGYWGEHLAVMVAHQPQGPWEVVVDRYLAPRGGDPAMNTYHAHLMPWLDGGLVISVSQNARNMLRDAWPRPDRYRLQFLGGPLVRPGDIPVPGLPDWPAPPPAPPPTPPPTGSTTTSTPTTTSSTTTTTTVEPTTTSTLPTTSTDPPTTLPAAPTATAIDPPAGPQTGGNPITVTGTGFIAGATTATVTPHGGGPTVTIPPGAVTIDSTRTTATFVLPGVAAPGAAKISLTTSGGTSGVVDYQYVPAPTATALDPAAGPLAGGFGIPLIRHDLCAGATTIEVTPPGAVEPTTIEPVDVTVDPTGTSATFVVPAATTAGAATVVVATAGGAAAPLAYEYVAV